MRERQPPLPQPATEPIRIDRDAGVVTITLQRPEAHNALTPELFDRLGAHFEEIAADPGDRVVVLTGSGKAFCSGADLTGSGDAVRRITEGPVARAEFARRTTAAALALHRLPKPTISTLR